MIRPIDLQTLFMNLEKVSKETSVMKEAPAQAQANQVQKLQKEHDAGQHSVGRTGTLEGAESELRVQDDTHSNSNYGSDSPKGEASEQETETSVKKKEGWKDPELGKHVDLSG